MNIRDIVDRLGYRVCAILLLILLGVVVSEARGVTSQRSLENSAERPGLISSVRSTPRRALGAGQETAIVEGIVFGRTENVNPERRDLFRRAGLWHLMAASGQNIALVIAMSIVVAWSFGGGKALGCYIALIAVPAYVVLVGGGASIIRAGIMGEIGLVAWLLGRPRSAWDALLVSAAMLVWFSPGSHRTLGFQLSYACVVVLLLFAGRMGCWMQNLLQIPRSLALGAAATLLCSAATAPILLARTGSAPFLASVSNLVAVPTAGVVLVVGLTGVIGQLLAPPIGVPLLWLASRGAMVLNTVASAAVQIPFATITRWRELFVVVLMGTIAMLVRRRVVGKFKHLLLFIGIVWATCFLPISGVANHTEMGRVAILDVGQGDAIAIIDKGATVLVDTGPAAGNVSQRLRHIGVRKLEGIVITHDQIDHDGALFEVVQTFHPRWIAIPKAGPGDWSLIRSSGVGVREICVGSTFSSVSWHIEVVNPPCRGRLAGISADAANDAAAVLVVHMGGVSFLLTADAESGILRQIKFPPVDVLKVSHHGSRDEGLESFLKVVRPRVAAISVGSHNRYGHPATEVLALLEKRGIAIQRTDQLGSIVYETDGKRLWLR